MLFSVFEQINDPSSYTHRGALAARALHLVVVPPLCAFHVGVLLALEAVWGQNYKRNLCEASSSGISFGMTWFNETGHLCLAKNMYIWCLAICNELFVIILEYNIRRMDKLKVEQSVAFIIIGAILTFIQNLKLSHWWECSNCLQCSFYKFLTVGQELELDMANWLLPKYQKF